VSFIKFFLLILTVKNLKIGSYLISL